MQRLLTVCRRVAPALGAGLALLGASGCYTYQDVDGLSEIPADARIRLQLSEASGTQERFGTAAPTGKVEGRLLKASSDSLYLESDGSLDRAGYALRRGVGDTIRAARDQVHQVSVRKLSRTRTAVVAGGTALAIGGYVLLSFDSSGGSRQPGNSPGGPEASVIPIVLSIPVP